MLLKVTVKTKKSLEKIEKTSPENSYLIHTSKPTHKNEANEAVIKTIANYFHIPKSFITIKSGLHSKTKIIELLEK